MKNTNKKPISWKQFLKEEGVETKVFLRLIKSEIEDEEQASQWYQDLSRDARHENLNLPVPGIKDGTLRIPEILESIAEDEKRHGEWLCAISAVFEAAA